VSFDMAKPGELTILPPAGEENAEPIILPLSWKPRMRRDGCALRIVVDRPRQFTVSFGTSGKVLHVFANPSFNEPHGKDEIVFGPGEHHVGVVVPKSGQTVRIEEGAVVYGAILVAHAKDVTITGRGIVDGSFLDRADTKCSAYQAAVRAGLPEGFYGAQMAVTAFTCAWSTNVVVRGVTFRDPPRWTMIVRAQSKDVLIENVKIVGCWRYNADGINVCASENVVIRD
jgi:polygalacturonase